jgi:hypothetical protein
MSTTREVAGQIALKAFADEHDSWRRKELVDAIDKALQAERERAAKIADNYASGREMLRRESEAVMNARQRIAAAIREGKPQE